MSARDEIRQREQALKELESAEAFIKSKEAERFSITWAERYDSISGYGNRVFYPTPSLSHRLRQVVGTWILEQQSALGVEPKD